MNTKAEILALPEAEKRERAKQQLFEYLFTWDKFESIPTDDELETIMNICQGGSDVGRALLELQTEHTNLLDIIAQMRAAQVAYEACYPGERGATGIGKELWEKAVDQFIQEQNTSNIHIQNPPNHVTE